MGWYHAHVLPAAIDAAMGAAPIQRARALAVAGARGDVLEIGVGSGHNLLALPPTIASLTAVDPHPGLLTRARARARRVPFPVAFVEGDAEALPIADASVDAVVCTWTLCSVRDPERVLAEVRRVLRVGGRLHFIEHGRSPDARVAAWQRRLDPAWGRVAGGCHLSRDVPALVGASGLGVEGMRSFHLTGPRVAGWTTAGIAVKAGG